MIINWICIVSNQEQKLLLKALKNTSFSYNWKHKKSMKQSELQHYAPFETDIEPVPSTVFMVQYCSLDSLCVLFLNFLVCQKIKRKKILDEFLLHYFTNLMEHFLRDWHTFGQWPPSWLITDTVKSLAFYSECRDVPRLFGVPGASMTADLHHSSIRPAT